MSLLHSTSSNLMSSSYPATADFRKGLEYVLDSHLSHHHHHDAAFLSFTQQQQQQQQQQDNYYYAAHSNSSSDENKNNGGSFDLPNYMLSPPPPPLPTDDDDVKQEQIGGGGGSTPQFINMDDPPTQEEEEESNKINNSCMDFPHKMSSSPLVRHSSSPADFFSTFALHNHHHGLGAINGPPNTVTNNVMNFSSLSESRPVMPCIAETGNGRHFMSTLATSDESWGNAGQKRPRDSSSEENGPHHASLAHHMSLPANFGGVVAAADNLLQFEGHVPCKTRAKRGFATHPRSIAERVRRSRISKKMTKLQDLFPDMDKQTSQADMLDMAVDHIKKLEKQVKALAEKKAKCSCPAGEEEQKQC